MQRVLNAVGAGRHPAVMLGQSDSIFVKSLAEVWRSKGLDVVVISDPPGQQPGSRKTENLTFAERFMERSIIAIEEVSVRFGRKRFHRLLGRQAESWEEGITFDLMRAMPLARAARELKPAFVFGQQVSAYGIPTVLCKGVPRILFPWGGDVMTGAETSRTKFEITRAVLKRADLIIPASAVAEQHIKQRFGISSSKVKTLSWGVDLVRFRRADPRRRMEICRALSIPQDSVTVLNSRRFKSIWGSATILPAFIRAARALPNAHFILMGGQSATQEIDDARRVIADSGVSRQFTTFREDLPLDTVRDLMSISDISLSLMGRGDMRSSSVLQSAACGCSIILAEHPEYRFIERSGFRADFVPQNDAEAASAAIIRLATNPNARKQMASENSAYLTTYEDSEKQMDEMLRLINNLVNQYREGNYNP